MPYWSDTFAASPHTKAHPNGVVTHGALEPVLTVLEFGGFPLRDLFLIGFNDSCGSIWVETESRAENVAAALEPAYACRAKPHSHGGVTVAWEVTFDRRELDGTVPSHFVTDVTMEDGTVVIKDGRWVR
jgi:hypothetical protein